MSERKRDDEPIDLSAWAAPTPPRGIANRVMEAVKASGGAGEEGPSTRPRSRSASLRMSGRRWRGIALGLAGAAAAAAIAWAVWPRPRGGAPTSGQVVAEAPSKVVLGGGSVALLGAGADVAWERTAAGLTVTQAAGEVTYQHAGPSGLVIITPLAEVHTAGATLDVEVPMSSKSKVAIAGVAGAGLAAAVVIAVYEGKAEVREPAASPRVVEAGAQVAIAPTGATRAPFAPVAKATKDRTQRDALAAAIASVRATRAATGTGGGPAPGGPPAPGGGQVDLTPGQLSKEEIRTSVREVVPLLVDCYTLMLDKHPRLGGKVIARLVVDAEPDLGTIVTMEDDSEVSMKGAAADTDPAALQTDLGDFRQCLGATLESLVLPPLGDKDGGRVEITYPFVFAPSEEEADEFDDAPAPVRQKRVRDDDPAPAMTADQLLADAEAAAKTSEWGRAIRQAETVMKMSGVPRGIVERAAMIVALGACNLGNAKKARAVFPRISPAAKNLVRQRCLSGGIEVEPGAPPAGELKDPFR